MTEKQLKRLIKQYTKARDEIIKKILSVKSIGTMVYYNTVLKEINRIIKKLSKQTHEVIETEIPDIYRKALEELYGYFTKNNLTMLPPNAFAQIHEDAVYDLVKEAEYHTDDALARVGRQVQRYLDVSRDEKLRQAGLKASAQKIATTSTIIDMQNSLEKELKSEGFMTVQYGSGKNAHQVPVETYVAMVARSTTREAGNIARENQLTANGYDLVKMTEHYPTCAVCSALQGRVFSISGKDTRFRPLSDAFSSGYRNVHPNCRHAIGPWIERGHSPEEVEAESKKSLAPLDDVRSSEERELYNKQQRQNREARQNYFQWKRYKERLGDDAPKSQLALERIKKKGGQEWEELQRKYRAAGVDKAGESGIIDLYKGKGICVVPDAEISKDIVYRVKQATERITSDFKVIEDYSEPISFADVIDGHAENVYSSVTGKNQIILDKSAFSDSEKLLYLLKSDFKTGRSYDTDYIESLVAHEIGHNAHIALALKRSQLPYGNPLTIIQRAVFENERKRISQEIYEAAFTDEEYNEIQELCVRQLGNMTLSNPNELVAQSFGNYYYGNTKSEIAEKIVKYFMKGLK